MNPEASNHTLNVPVPTHHQQFHPHRKKPISCLNCRERKVKCDKERPHCKCCTRRGVACVYIDPKKTGPKSSGKITKHFGKQPSSSSNMKLLLPVSQVPTNIPKTVPPSTKNGLIAKSMHCLPIESFKKSSKTQTDTGGLSDGTTKLTANEKSHILPTIQNIISPAPVSLPISKKNPISIFPETPSSEGQSAEPAVESSKSLSLNLTPATFGVTYAAASSSEHLKMLKLDQCGLTANDIDVLHNYWFSLPHMTSHVSPKRYYRYFNCDPQSVLHFSYMIWAQSAKEIQEYESKSTQLYEKSIEIGDAYWKNKQSLDNFNMHYYLRYMNERNFYEYLIGAGLNCSLTLSSCMRLAQLAGYSQIDVSPNNPITGKTARPFAFREISSGRTQLKGSFTQDHTIDDNLDPDLPLAEEKRRLFWDIYLGEKWYSLITGLPSSLSVDSQTLVYTALPSPTSFFSLNDSNGVESPNITDSSSVTSVYLHEAMEKLKSNEVMVDLNSCTSSILLLTMTENIVKWCNVFLNTTKLEDIDLPDAIPNMKSKIDDISNKFSRFESNVLYFDMDVGPMLRLLISNTKNILYHSMLIKMSCVFEKKLKTDPTGWNIDEERRNFFTNCLYAVSETTIEVFSQTIESGTVKELGYDVYLSLTNTLKSAYQCAAFFKQFGSFLLLDRSIESHLNALISRFLQQVSDQYSKAENFNSRCERLMRMMTHWSEMLRSQPGLISFFDIFL
ncbi:unnamed protein product [Ambrosiozyma monospora]|uniref:Unnamed protein product n=1 Tax=Ambrosiozyma monospora TaxID=43982 RepID=A0A9W6YRT8_AMBMO|nr:unnamed protein product [Ambrosiozyma monospora]